MNKIEMQDKWVCEYINNIDISNIEWLTLDSKELKKFFEDNYCDDECNSYVKEINLMPIEIPLGMFYLSYNYINNDFKYLLGVVPNNIGKKTIVGCLMYLDECYLFASQQDPVTYALSIEVNSYFRNKGIFGKMIKEFISRINPNQHLVVSKQSDIGKLYKVFNIVEAKAKECSFEKKVLYDDLDSKKELEKIVCENDYAYIKKTTISRSS